MEKFIIEVEDGQTICDNCPFKGNIPVCEYSCENGLCNRLDFNNLHISEYHENRI